MKQYLALRLFLSFIQKSLDRTFAFQHIWVLLRKTRGKPKYFFKPLFTSEGWLKFEEGHATGP